VVGETVVYHVMCDTNGRMTGWMGGCVVGLLGGWVDEQKQGEKI
jgi:hypothetical protein